MDRSGEMKLLKLIVNEGELVTEVSGLNGFRRGRAGGGGNNCCFVKEV